MISENAVYWIWIANALGYGNMKVKRLCELYDDIAAFYNGGEREWRFCGIFTKTELDKLKSVKLENSYEILEKCKKLGYSVLAIDDKNYPKCLFNIYDPPAVLYIDGKLPDADNRITVAIVGTRKAQDYGVNNSFKFAYSLSKYSVVIVSGGALGVDCASHRGVLAANGETICVLGCGINYKYLSENEGMRKAIARKNGAVISEYPPDEPPLRYHFPARNRIISALSDGVLIIEAGAKSGSLITANIAIDQGKDVFALIGNNTPQNEGSNNKIKDGTAMPVTDFMDILYEFSKNNGLYVNDEKIDLDSISVDDIEAVPVKGKKKSKSLIRKKTDVISDNNSAYDNAAEDKVDVKSSEAEEKTHIIVSDLSETAQRVYDFINNKPVHIDVISSNLNIPVYKVLSAVTQLEMRGLIVALQGRRYILK